MQLLKNINLLFAFLLEIAMLISVGYWGYRQGNSAFVHYLLAIGLPVLLIILWGIFAAPRSKRRIVFPYRLFFEGGLFLLAAVLLYNTGQTTYAFIFIVIALLNKMMAYFFKQ